MKTCHNLFVGVGFFILCCTMFTACVNHISEEEGEIINNGDIPLKFVPVKLRKECNLLELSVG